MADAALVLRTLLRGQEEKFPHHLAKNFPHVVTNLVAYWENPKAMEDYFADLLIPARLGRQGFPPDVATEIMGLHSAYDALSPKADEDRDVLWDPEEAKRELARIGLQRTISNFARAAEAGDHAACLLFISSGFSVDSRDSRNWTPLMMAAFNGKETLALKLIEQGADIHAQDNRGYTPMHWAAFNGYQKVIELLIRKGAGVNSPSQAGITPLIQAAARGHVEACTELLNSGARVNSIAKDGASALLKAVANGNLPVVNLLLAVGARLDASLENGKSLIEIAMSSRIPEMRDRITNMISS